MTDAAARLQIEKIYVKDVSLEIAERAAGLPRAGAAAARGPAAQRVARGSPTGSTRSVLTVTVTAKAGDKTLLPRRGGAGGHLPDPQRARGRPRAVLGIACPNILFPVRARGDLRPGHARRLPAGAARAGELRGDVRGSASRQQAAGAGPRIEIAH